MTTKKNGMVGLDFLIRKDTVFFFDMDGTLVDTNYANYMAYSDAIHEFLGTSNMITLDSHQRLTRTVVSGLMPYLSHSKLQQIITMKEACYKNYLSHTTVIKSVVGFLKMYSHTHKVVLVTKSCEDRANLILEYHGLERYFNDRFCHDHGNPTENKYAYAINKMKIDPRKVIVLENEPSEINHALAAGIPSTNILSPNDLDQYSYEAVYN